MEMDRGKQLSLFAGLSLGALLMFFLDAGSGGRRRAFVRDKSIKVSKKLARSVYDRAEDTGNRLRGAAAEARARLRHQTPTNEQLESRVRAELGHHVEHARGIEVLAENGRVTLRGETSSDERNDVLETAKDVNGVREVDDQLEISETAEDVPSIES